MREGREPGGSRARVAQARSTERSRSSAPELDTKYWLALALYGFLALLAWFTMGAGKVLVMGRPVEMRWIPLLVLGGLALRTMLARHAERIHDGGEEDGGSALDGK